MNYLKEKKIQAAAKKKVGKAIIEMSEQIPSLICINMINTNIFISPGASGLAEVHLQCVAYGNQVTTSKGDTQGILGDVVQAAAVRDLVDHRVDLGCSHQGSSGSSPIAEGNWKSCCVLRWPTSCGTALVVWLSTSKLPFSCRQLIKREKKTQMEKANELPTFCLHSLIPSPSVTGEAVEHSCESTVSVFASRAAQWSSQEQFRGADSLSLEEALYKYLCVCTI